MKIKKFPQSGLLVTTDTAKIMVDPGSLKFDESFSKEWKTVDAILVTHRHGDHIKADILEDFEVPIYSSSEVASAYPRLKFEIIKQGDMFKIGDVTIEVTKAVHGYNPRLKANKAEVIENIGYIIDDGKTRLYITSDTICFNNDYKADYVFAPVTGYGLTMTAFETALFTKEVGAKKLIVCHLDNNVYPSDISQVEKVLREQEVEFVIPAIGEIIDL